MTLPVVGQPISMSQVNVELGRANNQTISRGESAVRALAGVATGPIAMSNLQGKSAVTILISSLEIIDFTGGGSNASAGYQLTSGGKENEIIGGSVNEILTWCSPTNQAANYEVYATASGSPLTVGFLNTWVALSTTRTWRLDAGIGENLITTLNIAVRRIGTTTPQYTGTQILAADASF